VLSGLLARILPADALAITMTGELCDAFETKADGVRHIVKHAIDALADARGVSIPVFVWTTEGAWTRLEPGTAAPLTAAASNWLALAEFACRYTEGEPALLIDIGSTTTDIIPLRGGAPDPAGRTDTSRLLAGELVYTGISRTPVAMVTRELPYRGERCPVAAEVFATTLDAYLMLGELPEGSCRGETADGRPADRRHAGDRLARMVCADRTSFTVDDAMTAARAVRDAQERVIGEAIDRVIGRLGSSPSTVVVSGSGEFLARRLAAARGARIVSLGEELGPERSAAACAVALAELTRERWPELGARGAASQKFQYNPEVHRDAALNDEFRMTNSERMTKPE
jgi:probable H4MPT-linked C1 transfer pathway protein